MKPQRFNFPKIVIVGKPNVGKSTLFNRIIKKRKAIVEENGPTTRDRISVVLTWADKTFELVDTPGLDFEKKEKLYTLIEKQIMLAIKEADQIIFVCDAKTEILPLDYRICTLLRKTGKKVILVINKADNKKDLERKTEFYELGLGEPVSISSLHGLGIGDLLDIVVKELPPVHLVGGQPCPPTRWTKVVRLAVVGRPNTGKSSFINTILNEERIVVSDEPGTTRDSIDTYFEEDGRRFILTDTAGIRSKRKIKDNIIYFSILRTEESIKKSDVVIILLDAPLGVTKEDSRIISIVQENFKPFVLAVNKWDLAKKEKIDKSEYETAVRQAVNFIYNAPIIFISALKGDNVIAAIHLAYDMAERSKKNFSSRELNDTLKSIAFNKTKLFSIRQVKNMPPEFEIIAKRPEFIDESNRNYLTNIFRRKLGLEGIPVIIRFRKKTFK